MSWLTHDEAIRSAFEYRWRGQKSTEPILITDFDIKTLRVVEVLPCAWNNVATWRASERSMTDAEFAAINAHIRNSRGMMALGKEVMREQGQPVRVRGYVMRPGWNSFGFSEERGWKATVDIDAVRKQIERLVGSHDRSNDFADVRAVADNKITTAIGTSGWRITR